MPLAPAGGIAAPPRHCVDTTPTRSGIRDRALRPVPSGACTLSHNALHLGRVGLPRPGRGTGHDRLFGGMGDDLINADDNLDTNSGLNNQPDAPAFADADFGFSFVAVAAFILWWNALSSTRW